MPDSRTIEDIVALCKCSVTLEIDDYKDNYLTLEEGLFDVQKRFGVTDDIIEEMRIRDHIISLQTYPNTPIGFECVYGGTVQSVIDRMHALLTQGPE